MTVGIPLVSAAVMATIVAISVVTDARRGKIHNVVTVPGAIIGIVLKAVEYGLEGQVLSGIAESILGIAVGLGMFVFSSLFGRILGGGDIKLLMAIGAIQGPVFLLWTIVYMALIGGVMAILITLWHKDFLASLRRLSSGLSMRMLAKVPIDVGESKRPARLPYAIPIGLGSFVALYVLQILQVDILSLL